MANTGNTQQQINYGAAANDGQGDPLRTAFIKTDDNFDAIWNAGPVGSNITIVNNTIQSNNVNGNLVLRPNGVGVVQANASVIPNATNLRDLGTADLRWRAAYVGTGGLSVDGNVTVTGNLTAGNISYTGNVFVGDLQGSVFADDSTIMVDAIDNEMFASAATFGRANVTGNVSANYFIGNGSLLTGVTSNYGNAEVANYLASDFGTAGSNTVVTAGNIVGQALDVADISHVFPIGIQTNGGGVWEFAGNILRGPQGGSWSSDAATSYFNSPANGFLNLSSLQNGNVVSEIFMEHSFIRFLVDNGGPEKTWQMNLGGEFSVPGDIIPQSNGTASLGNATNYWSNLWVANNTIYIGGVPLGVTGNVLTVNGEPVLSNDSQSNIATTGTITAGNIITNGISSDDSTFVTVQDGLNVAGDIEATGNITAPYFIGNGSQLTGVASTGNITFANTTISAPDGGSMTLQVRDSEQLVRSSLLLDRRFGQTRLSSFSAQEEASYNILDWSTATWTGNSLDFVDAPDIAAFASDVYGDALNREFSINGGVRLPYDGFSRDNNNISFATTVAADPDPTTVTTIEFFYQYQSRIQMDYDNDELLIEARGMDITIDGDDDIDIQAASGVRIAGNDVVSLRNRSATEPVTIVTDFDDAERTWEFAADGTLTIPGDIVVAGDVVGTSSASTLYVKAQPGSNTYLQLNNSVDSVISTVANLEIRTDVSNTAQTWEFDTTGNLVVPGNINFGGDACAAPSLNDFSSVTAAGDFDIVTGTGGTARTFEFGADGRLILPESNEANVAKLTSPPNDANVSLQLYSGNAVRIVSNTTGEPFVWTFGTTGTFTAAGNISGGNIITDGRVLASGNILGLNFGTEGSVQASSVEATGNITGANLSVTGNITGNTAGFAIGYRDIPQVSFTGNATIAAADAGKHFYSTQSTDYILTIADNSAVSWPVGTAITVVNRGTGNITVAQAAGVNLYLAGNSSAGNRTVSTYGMVTLLNVAANVWMINGTGVA